MVYVARDIGDDALATGQTEYNVRAMETETIEAPETRQEPSIMIVSDFVCPWCYIGLMEIEKLSQEYDFEVKLAPYLLRPETPPEGITPRHVVPEGAPPTATEERAEKLGIKFTRGRKWSSNSHLALQASAFAYDYGDQWRFHRAMFKAYFEDLADIGQIDTVVTVGESIGMDASALRQALEEGRYREHVDEGIAWTRGIGVTAIPTFIINQEYGLVGAQEIEAFRSVMEKIGQPPKA
ncbi:MAG: thioredoxin domain-containing protein [Dehalococcoidia bacterium]|nr:thioredoxin domain-containing protein [Dehalococcoidia bacterium]